MKSSKLDLLLQSIRRNALDFALSGIGIVVGITTLIFFTSLGNGIKAFVLEDVFVMRKLEVLPPNVESGGLGGNLWGGKEATGLTDETVEKIRKLDGVETAYPKMKLTFPASVRGGKGLVGDNLIAEFVGDGIPHELVHLQNESEFTFRDWEAIQCQKSSDCPESYRCDGKICRGRQCAADSACQSPAYCSRRTDRCEYPVPVIASPRLIEIFNSSVHTALAGAEGMVSNLPELDREMLVGFEFDLYLGRSLIGRAKKGGSRRRRMRLVGFSEKAIDIGATVPIGYTRRWNETWGVEGASKAYHSIVVETTSNQAVASVAKQITDEFNLRLSDDYQQAQRAGTLITILTIVFDLISLAILIISAIHIAHTFSMIILERQREIGLMRAVGASKWDVRRQVLGEASIVGFVSGLIGVAAAWGVIALVNYGFVQYIPSFPFKPETLFSTEWWMVVMALGVSIVFCLLGAVIPALRASRIDPGRVLSGR
jgi:ABC-type lipoprotein release transport system permease subunit